MTIIGSAFVQLQPYIGDFAGVTAAEMSAVGTKAGGVFSASFLKGLGRVGLGMAAVGAVMTKLSINEQASLALLKNAIKDTGGQYSTYAAQIDTVDAKAAHYGITNTAANNTLASLTRGLGSAKAALAAMIPVENLAAAMHEDLGSAAQQWVRISAGQYRMLAVLGINIKNMNKALSEQVSTQKAATSAATAETKAQTTLSQLKARIAASGKGASGAADLADVEQKNALALQAAQLRVSEAQQKLNDAVTAKEQQTAQNAMASAALHLQTVQIDNAEKLATAQGKVTKSGMTLAQSQQLTNDEARVTATIQKHAQALLAVKAANVLLMKTTGGRTVQQIVEAKTSGAADALAGTWQGILNTFRAKMEDWAAEFGKEWGIPLLAAGAGIYAFTKIVPLFKEGGAISKFGSWAKQILGGTGPTGVTTTTTMQTAGVTLQSAAEALMAAAEKLSMASGFGGGVGKGVSAAEGEAAIGAEAPVVEKEVTGFLGSGMSIASIAPAAIMALAAGIGIGTLINNLPKLWGGKSLSTDIGNWISHGSLVQIRGQVVIQKNLDKTLPGAKDTVAMGVAHANASIATLQKATANLGVAEVAWGASGASIHRDQQQIVANIKEITSLEGYKQKLTTAQAEGITKLSPAQLTRIAQAAGLSIPHGAGVATMSEAIVNAIEAQDKIHQKTNDLLSKVVNPQRVASQFRPSVIVVSGSGSALVKSIDKALGVAS